MRHVLVLLLGSPPAIAQTAHVHLVNQTHPLSSEFQIGDRFEVRITGAPDQPISLRTVREGQTDWGPVIASTDSTGHWSIAGQFEKSDFGDWTEIWTVGAALATPTIHLSVQAPCPRGGQALAFQSGPNVYLLCDAADGSQHVDMPFLSHPIHTRDGRSVLALTDPTADRYHKEMLSASITNGDKEDPITFSSSTGGLGDETADLIRRLIGVNALNQDETERALAVIRKSFEKPETIAPGANEPVRTLEFLRHLAELDNSAAIKQQIADTIAYVQSR